MSDTLWAVTGGLSWTAILVVLVAAHHRARRTSARRRHPAARHDHYDQALRLGNSGARCSCGRRRPDREAMHHSTTRCQPRREAA